MLHIFNGDASYNVWQKTGTPPGDVLVWREALIAGPARLPLEERAAFLSNEYESPYSECVAYLLAQKEGLDRATELGEVVLWFDRDLFCWVNVAYLLHRLGQNERISWACIPDTGLGEENIGSVFESRAIMSKEARRSFVEFWEAYVSPSPEGLLALVSKNSFQHDAIAAHLSRFPSLRNGLGTDAKWLLECLGDGPLPFSTLFSEFKKRDSLQFGYGDFQLWKSALQLRPAVEISGGLSLRSHEFLRAHVSLTSLGREILLGGADFIRITGGDWWLGGVHLQGRGPVWRFDGRTLVWA